MSKKWILSVLSLVLSVSVITACGGEDEAAEENNEGSEAKEEEATKEGEAAQNDGEAAEQPKMPEPDLEGVPDVVAEVNGEEITKEEFTRTYESQFQRAAMQSQMTGQKVDQDQLKKQIAESMVGTELLIQEAENRDFDASEEDINNTLDELAKQNGLKSTEEFMAKLKEQGIDEKEVRSQVATQVKVDQLIANEVGEIEPTEEELQEMYDQFKTQQKQMGGEEAEVPSFDEMKSDLEKQVKRQKEGEATQALVEKLRENADVTVHV